jgi:hypothetical protein
MTPLGAPADGSDGPGRLPSCVGYAKAGVCGQFGRFLATYARAWGDGLLTCNGVAKTRPNCPGIGGLLRASLKDQSTSRRVAPSATCRK